MGTDRHRGKQVAGSLRRCDKTLPASAAPQPMISANCSVVSLHFSGISCTIDITVVAAMTYTGGGRI